MDYYMIGQRIRKIRKECGLSQEQLAEKVNISTTHMSHIETGNTKLSLPVLVDIAAVLKVKTDDILNNEEKWECSELKDDVLEVMGRCSSRERKFLAEILMATKLSMDKYL